MYAYSTCRHTHIHTQNVCISPLSSALIDVLFHSAQYKPRHHGYSCRDVLSLGVGQYWNNDSLNNATILTPLPSLSYHTSSIALFPCSVWHSLPCKGKLLELAALLTAWQVCVLCQLQPPTLVFLLEKPSRHGREPCGSRTGGSGNLLAQNQHQSTVVAEYCTCHWT